MSANNSDSGAAATVESLATRVRPLLLLVLDAVPGELLEWSLRLLRLLHAADTFPRGGLYGGHFALMAGLRYELCWLPLLARAQGARHPVAMVPPLDAAYAWLHHRIESPSTYHLDCHQLTSTLLDPPASQAFRFAGCHAYSACGSSEERQGWASREAWDGAYVQGAGAGAGSAARKQQQRRRGGAAGGGGGSDSSGDDDAPVGMPGDGGGGGTGGWMGGGGGRGSGGGGGGLAGGGSLRRPQGQYWPPAPPGSRWDLAAQLQAELNRQQQQQRRGASGAAAGGKAVAAAGWRQGGKGGVDEEGGEGEHETGRLGARLACRLGRLRPLLHSLLRPAYLDPDVLAQAVQRYCRFLMLQGMHPTVPLVPTTDIALMWVAHMAVPASYRATCLRLLGRVVDPAPGALGLDDDSPAFAETRRLYEHHFGEMYDPPITRPVPLEVLHPLLSTPLAPFLPAYDTAAPPPASHAAATAAATAAAGPFAPTTSSASATVHANPAWAADDCGSGGAAGCGGDGGGCVEGAAARCGAHALYLAYLMRRGATRSAKSLLGLVMGQGHRRKAAVRYVAHKADRFRDFLHLPHSDCHRYWSKLRLRHVDPGAVAAAGSEGGTPTRSHGSTATRDAAAAIPPGAQHADGTEQEHQQQLYGAGVRHPYNNELYDADHPYHPELDEELYSRRTAGRDAASMPSRGGASGGGAGRGPAAAAAGAVEDRAAGAGRPGGGVADTHAGGGGLRRLGSAGGVSGGGSSGGGGGRRRSVRVSWAEHGEAQEGGGVGEGGAGGAVLPGAADSRIVISAGSGPVAAAAAAAQMAGGGGGLHLASAVPSVSSASASSGGGGGGPQQQSTAAAAAFARQQQHRHGSPRRLRQAGAEVVPMDEAAAAAAAAAAERRREQELQLQRRFRRPREIQLIVPLQSLKDEAAAALYGSTVRQAGGTAATPSSERSSAVTTRSPARSRHSSLTGYDLVEGSYSTPLPNVRHGSSGLPAGVPSAATPSTPAPMEGGTGPACRTSPPTGGTASTGGSAPDREISFTPMTKAGVAVVAAAAAATAVPADQGEARGVGGSVAGSGTADEQGLRPAFPEPVHGGDVPLSPNMERKIDLDGQSTWAYGNPAFVEKASIPPPSPIGGVAPSWLDAAVAATEAAAATAAAAAAQLEAQGGGRGGNGAMRNRNISVSMAGLVSDEPTSERAGVDGAAAVQQGELLLLTPHAARGHHQPPSPTSTAFLSVLASPSSSSSSGTATYQDATSKGPTPARQTTSRAHSCEYDGNGSSRSSTHTAAAKTAAAAVRSSAGPSSRSQSGPAVPTRQDSSASDDGLGLDLEFCRTSRRSNAWSEDEATRGTPHSFASGSSVFAFHPPTAAMLNAAIGGAAAAAASSFHAPSPLRYGSGRSASTAAAGGTSLLASGGSTVYCTPGSPVVPHEPRTSFNCQLTATGSVGSPGLSSPVLGLPPRPERLPYNASRLGGGGGGGVHGGRAAAQDPSRLRTGSGVGAAGHKSLPSSGASSVHPPSSPGLAGRPVSAVGGYTAAGSPGLVTRGSAGRRGGTYGRSDAVDYLPGVSAVPGLLPAASEGAGGVVFGRSLRERYGSSGSAASTPGKGYAGAPGGGAAGRGAAGGGEAGVVGAGGGGGGGGLVVGARHGAAPDSPALGLPPRTGI